MVYIPDLDPCRYHSGPFDCTNWSIPLRAIGWLEHPEGFATGSVPDELIAKLKRMVEETHDVYRQYNFRGVKHCSFCQFDGLRSPGPIWSQENIFVPGATAIYVAPGGIVHYIEVHSYLPPQEFVEAVLRCPDFDTKEYRDELRRANRDVDPPLVDFETDKRKFDERIEKIRELKNT